MPPLSWLLAALLSTAFGQVCFKLYFMDRRRAWLAGAVILFLATPYATYNALKALSIATVYVATAASQLMIVCLSLLFLGERYSKLQWLGFFLVLAGVVLYNIRVFQ